MDRKKIEKTFWQDRAYYDRIEKLVDLNYPPFKKLKEISKSKRAILDVGCGDGLKLSHLGSKSSKLTGCEISATAITKGRKVYKHINFVKFDGYKLPFKENLFDLVVSMFVIEHTDSPGVLLSEMIKVTEKSGELAILAPNYGAPNRSSPNFIGSRTKKIIFGFSKDFKPQNIASWNKVAPKEKSSKDFETDDDTTIEPYLHSLISFFEKNNCKIKLADSVWSMELSNPKLHQKLFRFLGENGVFPFKYWGPHIFLLAEKQ